MSKTLRRFARVVAFALAFVVAGTTARAQYPITRISVDSSGAEGNMPSGFFFQPTLLADVPNEADRVPFDRWYRDQHMPDALRVFGALRAWRTWSRTDPSKHTAFYESPVWKQRTPLFNRPVSKS